MAYRMMSHCEGCLGASRASYRMTLGFMSSGTECGSGDQRNGYVEANETVKISMMHASLSQTLEFLNVSLSLPAATRSHIMGYKRHFVKNFLCAFMRQSIHRQW